jgi:hypothetical protein
VEGGGVGGELGDAEPSGVLEVLEEEEDVDLGAEFESRVRLSLSFFLSDEIVFEDFFEELPLSLWWEE